MKKTMTILTVIIALMSSLTATSQTLLARWTFPTGTPADSLADGGIPANLSKSIHTEGGTSAIDFSKNGLTNKAAQATGWDNGTMTKCWVVEITTLNYENLKISSKQQSGGNNPGPKDFMVQYRIGTGGAWTDVPNTVIVTANNWTSGVLDSVPLPDSCENRGSLFLRWLMTTNDNTAGGTVAATGIDKIEDIYITGKQLSTGLGNGTTAVVCRIAPNPAHGELTVTSPENMAEIFLLNLEGRCVKSQAVSGNRAVVSTSALPAGTYILKTKLRSGYVVLQKVVLY